MKTFDNCFSGSGAIEWLLHYLKTNDCFQSDISRGKAASLVNKLYHAGIFEEVQVTKNMRHKAEVQENRLYRFLPISPSKIKISRLPLAPRNDSGLFQNISNSKNKEATNRLRKETEKPEETEKKPQSRLSRKISILKKEKSKKESGSEGVAGAENTSYPPCHIITRILTTKEIKDTWKAVFSLRLRKVLGVSQLGDIVHSDLIDGYNVMHNCIYLNKSGVVTNIDAAEQLPHWVMSAMKCLAHWPEPAEPGLPNYPGFEKDVFRVIRDYFLALEEPLVPHQLYDVFTTVFVMCGHQEPQKQRSPYREEDSEEFTVPSSLWTSASLENIILNLTKKYCTLDSGTHRYGTHEDLTMLGEQQEQEKMFASQEDLRFAGRYANHFTGYNSSAFPSTDGMDRLSTRTKSMSRFAVQESCPSLPALAKNKDFLSKSTQSAANARNARTGGGSGFGRMYGSTPNLKVSKYETAFGPDNRTVTRVFYQNGFTTDLSHEDDDDDVFPPSTLPHNSHHQQSANCIYVNDREPSFGDPVVRRSMPRSNSTLGVVDCDFSSRPAVYQPTLDRNHRHRSCYEYPTDSRDPTSSDRMNLSIGQTVTLPRPNRSLLHDSSQASIHSAPETPGKALGKCSSGLLQRFDTELTGQYNTAPKPSPAVKSVVTSPVVFYPTEEKRTPVQQRSQSCLLKEMYGPGYRPPTRTYTRSRSQLQLSRGATTHTSTSSLHSIVSGNVGRSVGEGDAEILVDHQGYRPVLDASKERKMFRNSSSSSLLGRAPLPVEHSADPDGTMELHNSSRDRFTSTPMSASFDNANLWYMSGDSCPPSRIPAYTTSTSRETFRTAHSAKFMNYPQTRLSEERARNSLQLVALLLPPGSRRKLHLLFKLMVKMTSNPNLCLDPTQTTRSLVLSTFYKSILRSRKDDDEMVVLQLVSFMLDFYAEILSPPDNIKSQVSERLKVLQNPQNSEINLDYLSTDVCFQNTEINLDYLSTDVCFQNTEINLDYLSTNVCFQKLK
ncbi:DEP domain-containing protein 1A [Elysia marginata]|uniref:DEP domain-containing protein 1A n=1 Tax=Elysia marginata TaxID=1093978 RepID=A0AAV4GWF2_9GAST|nr:DEP domain-containing protein 1A [Elysia marginata]